MAQETLADFLARQGQPGPTAQATPQGAPAAGRTLADFLNESQTDAQTPQDAPGATNDEGPGWGTAALVGGGLLAAGALARNPGLAKTGLTKLNNLRLQSMLSGFAVPKSILGNVGAAVNEALERRSLTPLAEFFSPQTVKEFAQQYRSGGVAGPVAGYNPGKGWFPSPGRIMGAGDAATRSALQRGGLTAEEAERSVLQAPVTGHLGDFLNTPLARYAFPFRRTPWNQMFEGGKAIASHPVLSAGYGAAGGATGAATAEDQYPISIGLGTAASARYGMPFALGALIGRKLAGGKGAGTAASQILPVSEYGVEQSFTEPLTPFNPEETAAIRALRRLGIVPER